MDGGCALLGVRVDPLSIDDLNLVVARAIAARTRVLIGCHNLHSIHLWHRDPQMQCFYARADHIHIDGMAVVWLARLLGHPVSRRHRVTWLDWIDPLLEAAVANRWRVFYFGSRPGVIDAGARVWRERHPGLQLATTHGFIESGGPEANRAALAAIRGFAPDILMVGMGQPRQEKWILDNWDAIRAHVIVTPGACIDYAAGAVPLPPRWMGRVGLEWLFRLCTEPRRMWRRYLLEPWTLVGLFARDLAAWAARRLRQVA